MNLNNISQIRYGGKDITLAKLNGDILYRKETEEPIDNPYYIEYTIEAASPTDKVDDQKYIPNIKNMGDTGLHRNYDAIIIKLNDGTTTSDLNTYAKDVSKITIYYNEKTEQIRFRGSMFITVYVKEVNYIKTDNFITLSYMFLGCRRLQRINNMDKWITDNVTEMNTVFSYCTSLTSLDLSNFNTSNVTSMGNMFHNCSSLTSLDLSNFDTSKVTYMGLMFQGCSSLKTLKLSNFNTQNVIMTNGMFQGCSSLEVLDLSSFNTIKVNTFSNMFSGVPTNVDWCYDETNYTNWTLTEEQTGFSGTFPWNKQEEENPYYIEYTVSGLSNQTFESKPQYYLPQISTDGGRTYTRDYKKIEITLNDDSITSDLNVLAKDVKLVKFYYDENVTSMKVGATGNRINSINYIKTDNFARLSFSYCQQLTSIDLSNMNLNNIIYTSKMFLLCSRLTEIKGLTNLDTSNVTNMDSMFYGCKSLTSLDLSNFNTDSLEDVGQLFSGCESLTSLNLSTWDTNNVKSTSNMFKNIPSDIDWCYDPEDPNSYANWTLTEEQTGFNGTFPWNKQETANVTMICIDADTGDEITREVWQYPIGTEVNTYDLCTSVTIPGYEHGSCNGGVVLSLTEDYEFTHEFEDELSGGLRPGPGGMVMCKNCGLAVQYNGNPKCPNCGGLLFTEME